MFGLGGFKEKLEEAKAKAEETKQRMNTVYVEGKSQSIVTVISTANSEIKDVQFSDEIREMDPEELADHVINATNKALQKAKNVYEAEMAAVAQDAMPNIPGMPGMKDLFK
ncbi:YbaB/EbfC family nucleoid-associated protein [bacterium SCSIO 12741]|nr:YbaB/EbfC family nucleoid-associated protein [bacterium SCSIO 12741]